MERALRALAAAMMVATFAALTGCGSDPVLYVERPVEDLYNDAVDYLQTGDYQDAARAFDEVERQHPYSQWATRAQIMAAYAYYEAGSYDESIFAADRFIQLHPGHKDVAYAYYLIGQSYYERISDVKRDQRMTELAQDAFREVLRLFPASEYGRDAKLKLELTEDHLAGKEMDIGRWYQQREEYVGAINRFRSVIIGYQTTSHVPEALLRLTESYMALGVVGEAQNAAAVLGYNFPGSPWYEDAYALLGEHNLLPHLYEETDLIVEETDLIIEDSVRIDEDGNLIIESADPVIIEAES
ncbi:MAG: outer membrane protein assembly factor BamD [Rhodospirillaceae bacterium]|nr:outer membrane protein assembly factor BamD [Rhodospirillaceae bacterium]MBT6205645.1 outer membrane protein assembly factor BamD [Rhodospirillaceae bacterium]MBT6512224.1 outer membrane protein assembly factor BamD [Rhodospirillaceae bacterium]MBT7615406.1 outer membrane protein assembly factor BamD [Rhodospirillaceae bacterium]MBT7648974.1 outer membrane protein assembly factor BamD [Rhodospirillaceae bacterium]